MSHNSSDLQFSFELFKVTVITGFEQIADILPWALPWAESVGHNDLAMCGILRL